MGDVFDRVNINYEDMTKLNSIKRTLKSCIDMDVLIDKMKKIIDESEEFSFRSERAKKFINKNDPTFILSCSLLDKFKGLNPKDLSKLDTNKVSKLTDDITKLVNDKITSNVSNFINECVLDKEKFDSLFKNIPEEFSDILLTRIYIIRVSIVDNSVVVKLFN